MGVSIELGSGSTLKEVFPFPPGKTLSGLPTAQASPALMSWTKLMAALTVLW